MSYISCSSCGGSGSVSRPFSCGLCGGGGEINERVSETGYDGTTVYRTVSKLCSCGGVSSVSQSCSACCGRGSVETSSGNVTQPQRPQIAPFECPPSSTRAETLVSLLFSPLLFLIILPFRNPVLVIILVGLFLPDGCRQELVSKLGTKEVKEQKWEKEPWRRSYP